MPHSARAILSRSSAVRTECQSTTGRRRSMEKKSSSGTGAVGGSCAGSWQCIRSARESPNASANGSRVLISGRPMPRSQRLTALSVTCSFAASSACVNPRLRRTCARNAPNVFASMLSHPFPQDSTNLWKTQPTERLPTVCNSKKDVLPCGNTSFCYVRFSALRGLITAGGQRRPEPCRARCPRTS